MKIQLQRHCHLCYSWETRDIWKKIWRPHNKSLKHAPYTHIHNSLFVTLHSSFGNATSTSPRSQNLLISKLFNNTPCSNPHQSANLPSIKNWNSIHHFSRVLNCNSHVQDVLFHRQHIWGEICLLMPNVTSREKVCHRRGSEILGAYAWKNAIYHFTTESLQ